MRELPKESEKMFVLTEESKKAIMEELEYEWLLNRETIIPYKMCFGRFRELFRYNEKESKEILEHLEKEKKVILIPFSGIKVVFHVKTPYDFLFKDHGDKNEALDRRRKERSKNQSV